MKDISKFLYLGLVVAAIIFAILWFSNAKNTPEHKKETKLTSDWSSRTKDAPGQAKSTKLTTDQSMRGSPHYPKSPKERSFSLKAKANHPS